MRQSSKRSTTQPVNPVPLGETDAEAEEPPSPSEASAGRRRRTTSVPSPAATSRTRASKRMQPRASSSLRAGARPTVHTVEQSRTAAWRIPEVQDLEVVVLYSLALGLERGRPEDRIADVETASVAMDIAASLEGRVRMTHLVPVWDDLPVVLRQLDPRRHVIFNLVESLGGRAFTEPEPPRIFESMGFMYTGTDFKSIVRSANKLATKKLLESAGIPTPRCQVFRQPEVRRVAVNFPALVKPVAEGGSFGVTQDSIARDPAQLAERVRRCLEIYRQPAMAEEYIAGREINVALWGNRNPSVLPISEIVFQWTDDPLRQFVTFDSKWVADSVEYTGTPGICPAPLTSAEQGHIEEVAINAYRALGFRGFARVDMRLRDGVPYVLEVNANPDLASDAGFFRSASVAGYSYPDMVQHILQLAIEAHYA